MRPLPPSRIGARRAQLRGRADDAAARQERVREDADVSARPLEGVGADLAIGHDQEVQRMKAGSEGDVSALANTALDAGGDLAVEEAERGPGARDRDIAPVGQ